MTKTRSRSYVRPVLSSFDNARSFRESNAREAILDRIRSSASAFQSVGPWMTVAGNRTRTSQFWRIKIYVCVGVQSYWRTAEQVLFDETLRRYLLGAKVFINTDPKKRSDTAAADQRYSRPDKIICYIGETQAAMLACARLAELVKGRTHTLKHAVRADRIGFLSRTKANGLYVGLDPVFLGQSWRTYRAISLTWSDKNKRAIEEEFGSVELWRNRMNISAKHEGPVSLTCRGARSRAFIASQWQRIVGPSFQSIYG